LMFNDTVLQISEETLSGPSQSRPSAPPAKMGGLFVPRAAISRPRAGLGHARKASIGMSAKSMATATPSIGTTLSHSQQGCGQDDFRKMLGGGS
jgi:hypothetical protein